MGSLLLSFTPSFFSSVRAPLEHWVRSVSGVSFCLKVLVVALVFSTQKQTKKKHWRPIKQQTATFWTPSSLRIPGEVDNNAALRHILSDVIPSHPASALSPQSPRRGQAGWPLFFFFFVSWFYSFGIPLRPSRDVFFIFFPLNFS